MGRAHNHNRFCSVGLIPFADDITAAVRDFALAQDLKYESYYHDLPVWIVHEPQRQDTTRRVQITAYIVGSAPYLSLVPSVHTFVDEERSLVPKKVEPHRFPMMDLLDDHEEFQQEKFWERLGAVWTRTATLTFEAEQLMEVRMPKSIEVEPTAVIRSTVRGFSL